MFLFGGDMQIRPTENGGRIKEVNKFPFRSFIGELWWLALISRPDIVLAVHRCACEQNNPSEKLRRWVLRIIKYLKRTKKLGLT